MIFEDLEIIWREEKSHPSHTIDDEALRQLVSDRARTYRKNVFWRDASDIVVHLLTVALLFGVCLWGMLREGGAFLQDLAPLLVIGVGYTFTSLVRFIGRRRQNEREKEFGDSIRGNLQKLVSNSEYQIRLQSRFLWWYVVPVVPGYILLAASFWSSGPEAFSFMTLTLIAIFWFIMWGNQHSIRTHLIPQKEELESLLAGLENGGQTAEIRTKEESTRRPKKTAIALTVLVAALSIGLTGWVLKMSFWLPPAPAAPKFNDISAFESRDVAQIDAWLKETVERSNYPSLSVAIVREGKIVYQGVFGYENTWSRRVATTNTAYHVASVTKAFTATLAARLHHRGVIDLDEPVAKYLPGKVNISNTPELGAKITFRQLASHTSGLPRRVPGVVQSVEWRYELEPERLYQLLAGVTLEFEPGVSNRYSNLGFGLLGHALELAAKKPLNELLQEHLGGPLNLTHTAIHVDPDLQFATGYTTPPRLPERHSYQRRLAGSGGLVTSAGDLAKFLIAQLQPGFFTTNQLQELHMPTKLTDGSNSPRALAWRIDNDTPMGRILSKNGGRKNCSAWIGFSPGHKVGVAVLTNIGDPDVEPIGRWLLGRAIPGGHRPATENGHALVSPFTGIRWETDRVVVEVQGRWATLVSIDDVPLDRILTFAQREYGDRARERIGEDLPRVLFEMGHAPDWEVTLGLKKDDSPIERVTVPMTEANRDRVRDQRQGQQ